MLKSICMALGVGVMVPNQIHQDSVNKSYDILTSEGISIDSDNIYKRVAIGSNGMVNYAYLHNNGAIELSYSGDNISIKHKHKYAHHIIMGGFISNTLGSVLPTTSPNRITNKLSILAHVIGCGCLITGYYLKYSYNPDIKPLYNKRQTLESRTENK
jgi:hypothetical protein